MVQWASRSESRSESGTSFESICLQVLQDSIWVKSAGKWSKCSFVTYKILLDVEHVGTICQSDALFTMPPPTWLGYHNAFSVLSSHHWRVWFYSQVVRCCHAFFYWSTLHITGPIIQRHIEIEPETRSTKYQLYQTYCGQWIYKGEIFIFEQFILYC